MRDPQEKVLHLPDADVGIELAKGWLVDEGAIRSPEPTRGLLRISKDLLGQSPYSTDSYQPIRLFGQELVFSLSTRESPAGHRKKNGYLLGGQPVALAQGDQCLMPQPLLNTSM